MVLAAGLGSRLLPHTQTVPKCMTLVDGIPVLEHVVRHLASYGVNDVVINLHHLPEPVVDHFGGGDEFGVRIRWSPEPVLLGTAGGVAQAKDALSDRFLVWYGDNISTIRLDRLAALHVDRAADVTLAVFHREDVGSSGIVDVDALGLVHRFLEKPAPDQEFSHWVNAGIYIMEQSVLEGAPNGILWDFGRDVFPQLLASGRTLAGYRMGPDEHLSWIDSPQDLARMTSTRTDG